MIRCLWLSIYETHAFLARPMSTVRIRSVLAASFVCYLQRASWPGEASRCRDALDPRLTFFAGFTFVTEDFREYVFGEMVHKLILGLRRNATIFTADRHDALSPRAIGMPSSGQNCPIRDAGFLVGLAEVPS